MFSLSPSLSRSLSLSVTDQELNNGDGARLLARFSTPSLTFFFLSLLLLFLSSTAPARQRPPRPLRPSRRAQKVKRGKTENENAVSQLSVSLLIFTLSFPLFFFSLFLSRLSTTTRTHAAPALSPAAIAALYQNCLKLASENKITAKNTWALPLIDHLSDLVAPDAQAAEDEDAGGGGGAPGTDFQRASLTLAAGVSIYAHRVDAVHGDVFKILGGLGRGGLDDDGEGDGENDGDGGENGGGAGRGGPGNGRRNAHRRRNQNGEDADPSSTLDCLENINAKKFDLAFAVDPLFQRTAALFDEGGAAGLLLNSLPLLGGPALAFDSAAVPCAVDAGAAKAGTVGGGGARLPLGCLRQEAANALRALADPAAARPCPAQLALAEAAGRAVLPPGDDGGARGLVAGVVAEIAEVEAAEREAAAAERRGSGAEAEEAEGEGAADGNDEEEGGEEEGQAAGGWPELERAMAVAERAAAAAAAAAPPIAVVAAIAQAPSAVAAAPAALNATDAAVAAAAPLSASSPAASIQQQQQASDGDDDLGDGFGGDGGFDDDVEEEEEEAAGAARAAAAHAADSSPVLGGGAPARLLRHQDGDEQPSPMATAPGTPASPAECGGASSDQALRLVLAASAARGSGDGAGSLPPSSSHQTPPGSGGGIARAVSHADEEPPPTHAKAWAGAAHWRHRAARAARANVMGQENTEHDDGAGNGSNTFVGGMFGAPTPVRGGNPLAASSLPSSSSRPGAIDFSCLPPLDPRALARAPPRLTTLRAVRARAETLLPDDVHYSPQALSRLFDAPETTPAAAASAAAAGAAAAARRRLLGVSEEREEGEGSKRGGAKDLEEDGEDEEALGGGGLGGSDSDDDGAAAEAAAAAARAIATAVTAPTQQQLQQQQTARGAEAALLHSLALRDPDAPPRAWENPFAAGAAAGWGGTAPADGSAAAAALARAAAAAAASAASGANPMAYARAAKRVDVRALKVALWAEARAAAAEQQRQGGAAGGGAGEPAPAPLLFSELVSRVADGPRGRAAAPPGQLSPHLVFICLLHLCNEHSLELGRVEVAGGDGGELALTRKKLQPAVSLGGGADLTVAGVEVE